MRNRSKEKKNEEVNEPLINENNVNEEINKNDEKNKTSKDIIIENVYIFLIKLCSFIFKTLILVFKVSGIYLLWICLHYFSAHLYIKFCVPSTLYGFLISPFMIATPHCQGLRWIVYNAAGIINNMWILIGAWIYSMIWIFNNESNVDPII